MIGAWELGQYCMAILRNQNAFDVSVSFAFCSLKKKLLGQGKNSMLLILFIYVFMYVPRYVFI